jgi:hypothetical protein
MEPNPELGIFPNVAFIVMPSKFGDTNLGADCRGFYSAFYCCGERGKRDPGTQVGVFNDSVEMLVNIQGRIKLGRLVLREPRIQNTKAHRLIQR